MTSIDIQQYLDDRNRDLWIELNNKFSITLKYSPDKTYGVYSIKNSAIFSVPYGTVCSTGRYGKNT
jgi:hypothetical protein